MCACVVVSIAVSRSTSMSSLTNTTGTASVSTLSPHVIFNTNCDRVPQPQLSHVEHMAITEWLTSYKLADYGSVLESNGYETTELLVGISHEELQEMGINKIGHRKKLLSALSNWPQRESFFHTKPVSKWQMHVNSVMFIFGWVTVCTFK